MQFLARGKQRKVYFSVSKVQNKWGILIASHLTCPLYADTLRKCKFCLITEVPKHCKSCSHTSQIFKQRAVCLMNLFLKRSVKWQAYYISWLDSWFLKLENQFSRLKTWVTVNPLVSGTISTSFKYTCENHPPLYFKNHSTSWQKSWVLRIGLTAMIFFVFISSFCCTKNQSTYMKFI